MSLQSIASKSAWRYFQRLGGFRRELDTLRKFTSLPADIQRDDLVERMKRTLRFFSTHSFALPEWREVAKIEDPQEFLEGWKQIPITTKQDLQGRFSPHLIRASGLDGTLLSSGGSTGEPTSFLHDASMKRAVSASRIYANLQRGWTPGVPIVSVWGSNRDVGIRTRPMMRLAGWLRNTHILSAFRLDSSVLDDLIRVTSKMPRFCLYGYTSILTFLAELLLERGDDRFHGRVACAWNGAETLSSDQSLLFERAFGSPLLNHYGGRELSTIAFQRRKELPLSVLRPYIYVEVIPTRDSSSRGAETGRVICTSLASRATPFVRYEIGDLCQLEAGDVDESGVRSLSSISGRVTDTIPLPSGTQLHGTYWYHLATLFPEIAGFQIRWTPASIAALLVAPGMTDERIREYTQRARLVLKDVPLKVELVAHLPRTPQGKLMKIVREN